MVNRRNDQYNPDYAVPPGETLLEIIESIGMSQTELAERTHRPKKTISEIINGKTAITPETAIQFEHVLGVPAKFWMNLENNYRETLARLEEQERLEEQQEWLKTVPVKDMITKGWINKQSEVVEQFQEVLSFFGVASVDGWNDYWGKLLDSAAFRQSKAFKSDPSAVATWLRQGEREAQKIKCNEFNSTKFKKVLSDIKLLTGESPDVFVPELIKLAASAGVAVVFVREVPKCRVNGATRWLNSNKALIQLSLRYRTDDHLWFTFFHESGHILIHGKKAFFLEGEFDNAQVEAQADTFASDFLIPPKEYAKFCLDGDFCQSQVRMFSESLGIAPGIVVGRLQHDQVIPFSHLNSLKIQFAWRNET
jgi:addiction module HigA family antidote